MGQLKTFPIEEGTRPKVQPKGLAILQDAGVGEVPSGPGSPELPLEDVHAELGNPSLVHEGDKSETDILMH